MNFSFSALSLANKLGSPLFASPLMQRGSFSLKNSAAKRFASNFVSFSAFSGKSEFSRNKFSNFLSTPLYFNSYELSKQVVTSRKKVEDNQGPQVTIYSCLFQNCKSIGNGGALFVGGDTLTLQLTKSSFANCDSQEGQGGGVYFDGFSMYQKQSCYDMCESDTSGQAIYATTTPKKNLYIEGCSIDECTYRVTETGDETAAVDLFLGKQRLKESNVTRCRVSMMYCGFHTDDSDSIIFTFTNFEGNNGNILVGIEDAKSNDDLSYVNIINNFMPDEHYGLFYATTMTAFAHVVFIKNTPILVQADKELTFVFNKCVFDRPFGQDNVTRYVNVEWKDCLAKDEPNPYKFSVFDTRYCWMINPPTLPAGPTTYWFLLLFVTFVSAVGYTTFLSYKRIVAGVACSGAEVNPSPLIKSGDNVSYDSQK